MTTQFTTLRPGFLVSLSVGVRGDNVSYKKLDLDATKAVEGTAATVKRWETEKTVLDQAEYDRATEARTKARGVIAKVCSQTAFGLLCPATKLIELNNAVTEARAIVAAFNDDAKITKVYFSCLAGQINPNDKAAVEAINNEMAELISTMEQSLKALDAEGVREAAGRAKKLSAMLNNASQVQATIAIDAARALATKIVAAGDTGSVTIDTATLTALAESRTAFLDLSAANEAPAQIEVVTSSRALDYEEA